MQLYYKISEVSQIPMKYIINDVGVIKDANKLRGVKTGNGASPDRIITFEFNPAVGQERLTCEAGNNASASDLVLSSVAVLLGVYQALRHSSGEEDAEIMKEHIISLVNNPSFWNYNHHEDDAIDFTDLKTFMS